jgi:rubrerythrin
MTALTGKQEKLLVLFKKAIKGEQDAQKLYSEMLKSSDDPLIRSIIEEFIIQEKRHEELLLKKYNALRKTGEFKD